MITQNIQTKINKQINEELYSAYLYLGISAWFKEKNLNGFANWCYLQWQEEINHAMKFYNHILERNGSITLDAIQKPKLHANTPLSFFEMILHHEKHITKAIYTLYECAKQEKDYPLEVLLHWFIEEQVEEEDQAQYVVDQLKILQEDKVGLYQLDVELGKRK